MSSSIHPWLTQNWNTFASSLLIHGLAKLGVRAFFVSPGYRDAPFIAGLQAMPGLHLRSCWDERAGGYEALGFAKATRQPAVLICTSGTAAANYLPAVIEAKTDHVPLLVITADRPFELVYAAAQQVTDQRQIFGRFVKQSLDFPSPGPTLDAAAWLSYTRMLVDLSMDGRPGPVHINLPFRLPLDPLETADRPQQADLEQAEAMVRALRPSTHPALHTSLSIATRREWVDDMLSAERGLIILGRIQGREEQRAAAALAEKLGWPCFADITSAMKGRLESEISDPSLPDMAAALEVYRPDVCLHLGRRTVTGFFDSYLQRMQPRVYWVFSSEDGVQDPSHLPQRRQLNADIRSLVEVWSGSPFIPGGAHTTLWDQAEKARTKLKSLRTEQFSFADVAQEIVKALPTRDHGLFLGNSTAIRAFDSWCDLQGKRLPLVEANRGVNGIEGLVSTTLGLASGSGHAWTAVVGDISMIHDLNAVLALPQSISPIVLVVVNNSGGRIFDFLSIGAHAWVKDPLITTPHSFQFDGLTQMAGLDYRLCRTRAEFRDAYAAAVSSGRSVLLECLQDSTADQNFIARL